jgi:hypothetical protein
VHELNRVSYLWDERWLNLVMRVAPEIESRVQTLNKDTERLGVHTGLTVEEKVSGEGHTWAYQSVSLSL